jgi:GTP cyclohydrolase I
MPKKIFYSWSDFFRDIEIIIKREEWNLWKFVSVYGVPRGGISLALILSQKLGIPFCSERDQIKPSTLIVDDIIDSGKTRHSFPGQHFLALHGSCSEERTYTVNLHKKDEWIVYPWETNETEGPIDNVIRMIQAIGDDVSRPGLIDTPKRVIKSWNEIYAGYDQKPEDVVTVFDTEQYNEIVLLKDIELFSVCEHHMLPFIGKAHIGYIPDKKIIGISKLARILEIYAKRLQIQERLTNQVTECIQNLLDPVAVGCVIEAQHLCMRMRGVGKQNSIMTTSSLKGAFIEDSTKGMAAREEFMRLIR